MESTGVRDEVDSALCAGMRDPRERAALFRLENWYCDFCNSNSLWMDVGGAYNRCLVMGPPGEPADDLHQHAFVPLNPQQANSGHQTSFHRLLVHRLADRFFIRRESRSSNTIRLIKCPGETRVPPVLLQNLDPMVYYPDGIIAGNPNSAMHSTNPSYAPPPPDGRTEQASTPAEKQQRKRVIMKKRSPSNGQNVVLQKRPSAQQSQSGDSGSAATESRKMEFAGSRSSSSDHLEAKERAYAEARARIFNENEGGDEEDDAVVSSPTGDTNNTGDEDDAPTASVASLSIQTDNESPNDSSNNQSSELSPEAAGDRKAVYRNRAEEAADPDFQRGRIRGVPAANGGMVMATPVTSFNGHPVYYQTSARPGYQSSPSSATANSKAAPPLSVPLTASAPVFVPGGSSFAGTSPRTPTASPLSKNGNLSKTSSVQYQQAQRPRAWHQAPTIQIHHQQRYTSPREATQNQPSQHKQGDASNVSPANQRSATNVASSNSESSSAGAAVGVGPA